MAITPKYRYGPMPTVNLHKPSRILKEDWGKFVTWMGQSGRVSDLAITLDASQGSQLSVLMLQNGTRNRYSGWLMRDNGCVILPDFLEGLYEEYILNNDERKDFSRSVAYYVHDCNDFGPSRTRGLDFARPEREG